MTTRLNAVADRASGAAFGLTNYNNLEADVNWLALPGANLASASTLTVTNAFHIVTGTTTIATITDALGPVGGQRVTFLFQSVLTIQHIGGGTGNIRMFTRKDRTVNVNEMVSFVFDSSLSVWREDAPSRVVMRQPTTTTVATATETDLLAGALTVGANVMGIGRTVRVTAWGDYFQNAADPQSSPRFKVKLGATPTVVLDTSAVGSSVSSSVTKYGWRAVIEITNMGATNSQWVSLDLTMSMLGANSGITARAFTTGEGAFVISNIVASSQDSVGVAVGGGSAAIDTTADMAVAFSVIVAGGGASCKMTCQAALAELI